MSTVKEIQEQLQQAAQRGAIIFQPSTLVPESFYRPILETVVLGDDDVYVSQKKTRIRYDGLLKLANAAGIEWSAQDSGRLDDGRDKLYVAFRATGMIRKADGKLYPTASTYELDLELIREELVDQYKAKAREKNKDQNWVDYCVTRDWRQKRRHKLTLAESGAKSRVIRSILTLPSQYHKKAHIVNREFVIVRFVMDHGNQDIRNAMLAAARDNMAAIYGGTPATRALPIGGDTNVIDIPHQSPNDPQGADAPENPTPPTNSNSVPEEQMDGEIVDFENCDILTQVKELNRLAAQKNYDMGDYLSRARKSLDEFTQQKRTELFVYLKNLKRKAS